MHFLTCNPKAVVTKYHIDSNRIEKLPHSKIPHDHLFTDVKGFQVGKYFWIIGGMIPPDNQWAPMNVNKLLPKQLETDLWVMDRDIWIDGPKLHQKVLKTSGYCATVLNSTTVIFVGIGGSGKEVLTFDFGEKIWKKLPNIISGIEKCTYSSLQSKSTKQ